MIHHHHSPRRRGADHRAHRRPLDGLVRGLPPRRLAAIDPRRPGRQPRPRPLVGGLRHRRRAGRRPGLGAARRAVRCSPGPDATALGLGRRAWPSAPSLVASAPAWATWSSRVRSPASASGSPRPCSCGAGSAPSRCLAGYLAVVWAARLGRHHLDRGPGRRAVHRLRLLRRDRGRPAHRRSCRSRSHAERRCGHEPPRRLRHRPGRPPARPALVARPRRRRRQPQRRGDFPGARVVGGDATDPPSPPRSAPGRTSSTSASTR